MTRNEQLRNGAYLMIILIGIGYLGYLGKTIIIPILFGLILAVLLTGIHRFIKRFVKINWLAILLSFIVFLIPVSFLATLLGIQVMAICEDLPNIGSSVVEGGRKLSSFIQGFIPGANSAESTINSTTVTKYITENLDILGGGILRGTGILIFITLVFIYAFFFLLYKDSFRIFVIKRYDHLSKDEVVQSLNRFKALIKDYVIGVGTVMLILCVVNSIGLTIIGVDYAIFWGCLAGLLAIIPYIGSILGGALPFMYSLAVTEGLWQPMAILIFYTIVQQIEGNVITPKVVGNQVNINPLISIIGLFCFNAYWGVAGVILALPIISAVKLALGEFKITKPVSILMGTEFPELKEYYAEQKKKKNRKKGQEIQS